MKAIIKLLNWNEQQYADFIYESGIAYLEKYVPNDPHGIDLLVRSKIFWAWWKNHWRQRDEQFVAIANWSDRPSIRVLESVYRVVHDVDNLLNDIFPNAVVMHHSYAQMIGNVIKHAI